MNQIFINQKLCPKQKDQLTIFKRLLKSANLRLNLFSRKNPDKQLDFLFLQGLKTAGFLSPVLSQNKSPVLDIGSGGGFPGLLFAILYPSSPFDLCEKSLKKAEFLKQVLLKARILNARVLCLNVEKVKTLYQLILSQAALPLRKMPRILKKNLSPQGKAFLWQSEQSAKLWPKTVGLKQRAFISYTAGASSRVLLEIQKL